MLRAFVLCFGMLCCAGGGVGLAFGAGPAGLSALTLGFLILIGTIFERRYGSNHPAPPGPGWEPTMENFIDPASGEHFEVWYNSKTGKRSYIVRK